MGDSCESINFRRKCSQRFFLLYLYFSDGIFYNSQQILQKSHLFASFIMTFVKSYNAIADLFTWSKPRWHLCSSLYPRHSLLSSQFTYSVETESFDKNKTYDLGHFIFFRVHNSLSRSFPSLWRSLPLNNSSINLPRNSACTASRAHPRVGGLPGCSFPPPQLEI
jgi:hypothetical protein